MSLRPPSGSTPIADVYRMNNAFDSPSSNSTHTFGVLTGCSPFRGDDGWNLSRGTAPGSCGSDLRHSRGDGFNS